MRSRDVGYQGYAVHRKAVVRPLRSQGVAGARLEVDGSHDIVGDVGGDERLQVAIYLISRFLVSEADR